MALEASILIVDNDRAESARSVYDSLAPGSRFPMSYAVEPKRGEPHARNTAVRLSSHADFVAFIDDDSEPEPNWLKEILLAQAATSADIVAGACVLRYLDTPPDWLANRSYLDPSDAATLGKIDLDRCYVGAGTSNVLIHTRVFDALKPDPFPTRYPLSGGTDRELFLDAAWAGFTIAAAPAAVNREWIPPERMTRAYLLRRAYGAGRWPMRMSLKYHGLSASHFKQAAVSSVKLAWSICRGLVFVPGSERSFGYFYDAAMHLGSLAAFARIPPLKRYKHTDGS